MSFIRDLYVSDSDFGNVYFVYEHAAFQKLHKHDGYLFRENKLCVPNCSMRDIFVHELHYGGFDRSLWGCKRHMTYFVNIFIGLK